MAATRVVMHQIVLPAEVDSLGICFGGQVRPPWAFPHSHACQPLSCSLSFHAGWTSLLLGPKMIPSEL